MKSDPERNQPQLESSGTALSPAVEGALSFQTYAPAPTIHGVQLRKLRKSRSENGWFTELFRLDTEGCVEDAGGPHLSIRQVSASHAEPSRINAFHIHPREPQHELWTVVEGSLLVWLVDCRSGSITEGAKQPIVLSGEEPAQLFIPAGVAHGYRAGRKGALLIYAMNQQFRRENPNEGRLPWDYFGAEIWNEDRG